MDKMKNLKSPVNSELTKIFSLVQKPFDSTLKFCLKVLNTITAMIKIEYVLYGTKVLVDLLMALKWKSEFVKRSRHFIASETRNRSVISEDCFKNIDILARPKVC
jgi:hypothetical protein